MRCDKCEKWIKGEYYIIKIDCTSLGKEEAWNWDIWILCEDCWEKLKNWFYEGLRKNEE